MKLKDWLLFPFSEISMFITWFIFCFPGKTGSALRYIFAKCTLKECGKGVRFGQYSEIDCARNIVIKNNVTFDKRCELNACGGRIQIEEGCSFNRNVTINASVMGKISFGNQCLVGPHVIFRSANHGCDNLNQPIVEQGHRGGDIKIGNNVWIGAGAIILPNVSIGDGVIIGAGSLVSRCFEKNQVVGGVPAKVLRKRN